MVPGRSHPQILPESVQLHLPARPNMDPSAAHYAHRQGPPVKHAGPRQEQSPQELASPCDQWCLLSCPGLELTSSSGSARPGLCRRHISPDVDGEQAAGPQCAIAVSGLMIMLGVRLLRAAVAGV
jgi:hypothetical protein